MPPDVVALFGPTGVGKTAVAEALCARLREAGEEPVAISADALQLYRGLEVLTGAADAREHRLVGILDVTESCTAGAFAELAHAEIDRALADGRRPLVVGGTGLYLRAALAELDLRPAVEPAIRERLDDRLAREGLEALHADLARRAPETAAGIAATDRQRVLRALELLEAGHTPPPPSGAPSQLWTRDTRHPTLLIGLTRDREELRARIDARVDAMVGSGAMDEVRAADAAGASRGARQALGFEELLRGDVEGMKIRTRRYARRQLTWMRKLPGVHLVSLSDRDAADAAAEIHSVMMGGA